MKELVIKNFEKVYGTKARRVFFSPGRVNLIGEHIDYNGGMVFPLAITIGSYGALKVRNDSLIRIYSGNFESDGIIEFDISKKLSKDGNWGDYVKGVVDVFLKKGYQIKSGFDLYLIGNIPNGSGLSSSASLEMLIGIILDHLNNLNIERITMVKLAQQSENEFIGVSCGIMDQFAIGMGKENQAILLNTNTLEYQYAPFCLKDLSIVVMNTNKKRGLADSKYNERRKECDEALAILQTKYPIKALCELDLASLESQKDLFTNSVVYKRARHAISENLRVHQAFEALGNNDFKLVGQLLNESHKSLKNDYEVTGFNLDTIVEIAWNQKGVLGARMTGAGFGGCAIALVENQEVETFIKNVSTEYLNKTGLTPQLFVVIAGDGTKEI